jgi:V8-like Glu-specific endopeptidase
MGYPAGLPLKIAGNARLTSVTDAKTFSATLDALAGNSGGPVFNSKGIVEGIVSAGGLDFMSNDKDNCLTLAILPDTGVDGFVCTATAAFSQFVP